MNFNAFFEYFPRICKGQYDKISIIDLKVCSTDCEKIYSRIKTVYWNLKYFIELKHSILIPLPINHIYVKIRQELAFMH